MLIKIPSIKFRNVIEELNDHICIEIRLTLQSSILSLSFSLMIKDTTLKDETNVHDAMQFKTLIRSIIRSTRNGIRIPFVSTPLAIN